MGETANDKPVDADILKGKVDILRARDVIPPYDKQPSKQKHSTDTEEPSSKPAPPKPDASRIPKFDLADNIIAEQRKAAAVRRKPPTGSNAAEQRPKNRLAGAADEWSGQIMQMQDEIIREIVARDIEKMCRC